jgi:surface protein
MQKNFNQALDSWDISNVTDMSGMFKDAENFNQPLDSWDTSNVKDMREMFKGAIQFKQKTKQIEQEPKEIRNISDIGKF